MQPYSKLKSSRFVAFCLVGGTNSAVDIFFLYVGVSLANLPLFIAASISFVLASLNGYLLNQKLMFKNSAKSTKKYFQYLAVSIVGLLLTLALLHVFTAYLMIHYLIAKVITIILVVFWNYFINAFWTFRT